MDAVPRTLGNHATSCQHYWLMKLRPHSPHISNGGTIEKAQQIAAHESPTTTSLYDRTNDEITLDEIERVAI